MHQKCSFEWMSQAQEAFKEVERRMCSAPILALLDFSKGFEAKCEARGKEYWGL